MNAPTALSIETGCCPRLRKFKLKISVLFAVSIKPSRLLLTLLIRTLCHTALHTCMNSIVSSKLVPCLRFRGTQTIDLTIKEGGPLPFAYDILTSAFQYGNRVFTKYPHDIADYFKHTFPRGYSWERSMTYEDGGLCTVSSDIRLLTCLFEEIRVQYCVTAS